MKILIVTHYFPPEIGAPQARLSEFAKLWAEAGEDVTVLTGMPNHPTGVVPPEYKGAIRRVEYVDGYKVVRTWLYATPNEGVVKKTIGHLSFMFTSVLLGFFKAGKPDVVIVSSPTFFSIFSAWLISRLRRVPLVVEVRDLWPAIFVELGVLADPTVIRVLERLELWTYRQAMQVVVVSQGFKENLVQRGVLDTKVNVIRNGADIEHFSPGGDPIPGRNRLSAESDETLVLYVGAHGLSQGLETVIEAAQLVKDRPIRIALVGEGARRQALLADVASRGLTKVTMLPGVPRHDVPSLLAAADICLVPLRDLPLFSTFVPSKMFEYLAAGKAVIGAVRGETAELLEAAGALVVSPGDAAALSEAIAELANDRANRERMGSAGRRYMTEHFDRRMWASRYRTVLQSCVADRD